MCPSDVRPNPGSKEAIELGCTCPVYDNCHGVGFPWGETDPAFWISGDCPLHSGGSVGPEKQHKRVKTPTPQASEDTGTES